MKCPNCLSEMIFIISDLNPKCAESYCPNEIDCVNTNSMSFITKDLKQWDCYYYCFSFNKNIDGESKIFKLLGSNNPLICKKYTSLVQDINGSVYFEILSVNFIPISKNDNLHIEVCKLFDKLFKLSNFS